MYDQMNIEKWRSNELFRELDIQSLFHDHAMEKA